MGEQLDETEGPARARIPAHLTRAGNIQASYETATFSSLIAAKSVTSPPTRLLA
jgi:hypothetical protein